MKSKLFLVLIAVLLAGCENLHQTLRSGSSTGKPNSGHETILVGNHEFSNVDDLKIYVRSLPQGAILSWDKSSLGTNEIPLPHASMTVDQFGQFCRQMGAQFQIITAYERVVTTRAYHLNDSGFKTFVELIDHPGIPPETAKPLFEACGVPYAPDLMTFFKAEGVPFPPESSVSYDAENGRLIITNTRENETTFSGVIWSYETRVFDQKMRCLTARLKAQPAAP